MATAALDRDRVAELGIKLISADNHINEPRNLFVDRFPKHLKDKAPRVIEGADGGEGWAIDGKTPPKRTYGLEAMAGWDKKDYRVSGLRYDQLRPGNYDGAEHLKDMDKEVAMAGFTTYNDWILDEFQAANPKRLCGLALTPMEIGIEETVAEMKRVHKKGCRAMFIPGSPTVPYNHPDHYEPVWQTAHELGITLCMHRNHGGPPDKTDWDFYQQDQVSIGGIVTRYFSCIRPLSYMIFTGMFDRYPDLKIVGAEVDCGWAPFWVQTLDHHWEIQTNWFPVKLKHPPSDFIGKNIFTTNVDDYAGYQMIGTGLWPWLSSMTMFSSDYPHSATIWPDSRAVANKMIEGLRPEDARKALQDNAVRVFGFEV
jgi:predicted TIM-barrel fold metal-dependent hydrolase